MNKIPAKPKTTKEQVDKLWDIVTNDIMTRLRWQDIKINFILTLVAIILALTAIAVLK